MSNFSDGFLDAPLLSDSIRSLTARLFVRISSHMDRKVSENVFLKEMRTLDR